MSVPPRVYWDRIGIEPVTIVDFVTDPPPSPVGHTRLEFDMHRWRTDASRWVAVPVQPATQTEILEVCAFVQSEHPSESVHGYLSVDYARANGLLLDDT